MQKRLFLLWSTLKLLLVQKQICVSASSKETEKPPFSNQSRNQNEGRFSVSMKVICRWNNVTIHCLNMFFICPLWGGYIMIDLSSQWGRGAPLEHIYWYTVTAKYRTFGSHLNVKWDGRRQQHNRYFYQMSGNKSQLKQKLKPDRRSSNCFSFPCNCFLIEDGWDVRFLDWSTWFFLLKDRRRHIQIFFLLNHTNWKKIH